MSEVLRLVSDPLAARVGLVLLHFLWQGALLGIAAGLLLLVLRKASAASRYAALLAILLAMALCPLVTFLATARVPLPPPPHAAAAAPEWVETTPPVQEAARPVSAAGRAGLPPQTAAATAPAPARPTPWAPRLRVWVLARLAWIGLLWLAGVVLLSLRFLWQGYTLRRAVRGLQPAEPVWQDRLASLCRHFALTRPVKVLVSAAANVPVLAGWLRPTVVLPACLLTGLTPDQVTALLAHELAHLRRRDQWVGLLQTVVELLLFYHPAVWWVSRALRAEREHCCDDAAVAVSGDVAGYMRALAWVDEHRESRLQPALAASGSPLLARIRRLAGPRTTHESRSTWLPAMLALAMVSVVLMAAAVSAQAPGGHAGGLRDQWQPQTENDPRLQQPVHIEIIGRGAIPALELLSKETGVTLRVAPEDLETVGDRKLTIIAQGCSLKALLVQIPRALQECHFDIDRSGPQPVYLLHRNGSAEATMVEVIAEEPAILAEGTRPAREARIAAARTALAMSPNELKEVAKTDPLLAAAVQDPETRRAMELFLSLPDDTVQEFSRTGWLPISMSAASSGLQQSVRDHAASRYQEAKQKNEGLEFWQGFTESLDQANLTYQDTDRYGPIGWGITLQMDATAKSGMTYGDSTLVVPPRGPGEHGNPFLRGLLVRTGMEATAADALLADLAKQAERERLVARDQRRQRDWREPQSPALHKEMVLPFTDPVNPVQVQQFLAKETGLSIVSDYFTTWGPRPIPEEARAKMPAWRLLYLLGESWFWQYEWNEAGDCLVFHDRTWASKSLEECPESLLTAFREKLAKQGAFTLDDAAAFAVELDRRRPHDPKLRKTHPTVPSDLEGAGLSSPAVDSGVLLLYATLTSAQKVRASSKAGLAYGGMTSAQQARVAQIGQEDNDGRPLPAGEVSQAVFRTTFAHKTPQEILKELGMPEGTPVGDMKPQDIESVVVEFPSRRVAVNLRLRPAAPQP